MERRDVAVQGTFDYTGLDANTMGLLRDLGRRIRERDREATLAVLQIGADLKVARERCPHGQWEAWVRGEAGYSPQTAHRLIQVADRFKSLTVRDLQIQPSALYALAAPSTPDEAVAEAIERAEHGEPITKAIAHEIVGRHRGKRSTQRPRVFPTDRWPEDDDDAGDEPEPSAIEVVPHESAPRPDELFWQGIRAVPGAQQELHAAALQVLFAKLLRALSGSVLCVGPDEIVPALDQRDRELALQQIVGDVERWRQRWAAALARTKQIRIVGKES
jgi:hypothetical protein